MNAAQNIINICRIVETAATVCELYESLQEQSRRRRWWVRPVNLTRDEQGFYKTCMQQLEQMDEEHFYKATRMSVASYKYLLAMLKERLSRFSNRKPISPEIRLAVTIIYLAQGCSVNVLAWAYKLGMSTVRKIIYETCQAIWDEMHVTYVAPPNTTEMKTTSDKFFIKTGLPNCVGAIDGKHIRIVCPPKSGSLYYNYKRFYSIVLLAACDANYVFTYIDVGALGSQSDGGVFSRSLFGRKLLNQTLAMPPDNNLPGTRISVPYHFVGDSAFPLKLNLMRPYPGRNLEHDKANFNKIMSKARVHIENAFGILANRFRIFHTAINASPRNVDKIVLATIALHNFLMLQNDRNYFTLELVDHMQNNVEVQGLWRRESSPLVSFRQSVGNRSTSSAYEVRDTIKNFLSNNS